MTVINRLATLGVILLLAVSTVYGAEKADLVRVVKREKRLYLIKEGEVFASFHVAFGGNPMGTENSRGISGHPKVGTHSTTRTPATSTTSPSTFPTPTPRTASTRANWGSVRVATS